MKFAATACMLAAAAGVAACAHLPTYGTSVPATGATPTVAPLPSPSTGSTAPPSGAPSPAGSGTCLQADRSATVTVAISLAISAVSTSYGSVSGYAAVDAGGVAPDVAAPVTAHASDRIQFVNVDNSAGTSTADILHSAVGFSAAAFPGTPYAFSASSALPLGTAIGTALWSTGTLAPNCYSRVFTVTPGTYYFGDANYYNTSESLRDTIVVTAS